MTSKVSPANATARNHGAAGYLPGWLAPPILVLVIVAGLIIRLSGIRTREYIPDEGFSLLAAQTVADRGIPLLPSGVLYLHGTVLSYLLAPFIAAGLDPIDHLFVLRLVSVLAGVISIILTYLLARTVGASQATSLLAAALVALDPASVLWSGYARMYSLAQPLALGVTLLFLQATAFPPLSGRARQSRVPALAALVLLFWLAVFTHLATALLWPAMAAAAIVIYGTALVNARRDLLIALGLCLLAPLTLVGLTGAIGPGAGTTIAGRAEGLPGISFLGEDNVNLGQLLQPDPSSWTNLFATGPLALVAPLLLTLASGIAIGHLLLESGVDEPAGIRRSTGVLLALYWLPILLLALFATDAAERYALFLLPIGYVLLALAIEALASPRRGEPRSPWAVAGGAALALVMLLHGVIGSANAIGNAGQSSAVGSGEAYVAAHWQPGELILTSSSVDSALRLGQLPELRYLPGGEGSQRALRYTRFTDDGAAIDYWIGMPSLWTTDALCTTLEGAPGSWIVLSDNVWDIWGYNDLPRRQTERQAGAMRELILGLADSVYEDDETIVFRSRSVDMWTDGARKTCGEDASPSRGKRQKRPVSDATPVP